MNQPNEIRNKLIVIAKKVDPETFTDPNLADILGITKQAVHKIQKRDWEKYELPVFTGKKIK